MTQPEYIFFQNRFVNSEDAKVSVLTHALHYSTSCFEGIRGNWNETDGAIYAFRLEDHYERLRYSASMLKIKLEHSTEELCRITQELVQKCGYRQDVYIRPMAYKSSDTLVNLVLDTLEDDLMIAVFPIGNYLKQSTPIRCMTSAWTKPHDVSVPSSTKIAGVYTTNILAKTDAVSKGFDEAIMLTHGGNVSEGSGENIFLVINGELHTPPGSDNCLQGITRSSVIQIAREIFGMRVHERSLLRSELYRADEMFLTGTAAHVTAVGEVDNRPVGNNGKLGPVTERIRDAYFEIIYGSDERYMNWCWPIKV